MVPSCGPWRAPLLVGLLPAWAAAQSGHYDLSADFSTVQNPNPPWSYNIGDDPITTPGAANGCAGWTAHPLFDGSILVAESPPTWGVFNDWQVGDVTVHAWTWQFGGQTTFANVRWTAPFSGTIDITGAAWDAAFYSGRDAAWTLLVRGEAIAHRGSVFGLTRAAPGASLAENLEPGRSLDSIKVSAGDVVEIRVEATTYYSHFTGVKLVIDRGCYADCNADGILNLADFGCFQTRFALGDPYSDCNSDSVLNLADFGCFQTQFALGCP